MEQTLHFRKFHTLEDILNKTNLKAKQMNEPDHNLDNYYLIDESCFYISCFVDNGLLNSITINEKDDIDDTFDVLDELLITFNNRFCTSVEVDDDLRGTNSLNDEIYDDITKKFGYIINDDVVSGGLRTFYKPYEYRYDKRDLRQLGSLILSNFHQDYGTIKVTADVLVLDNSRHMNIGVLDIFNKFMGKTITYYMKDDGFEYEVK